MFMYNFYTAKLPNASDFKDSFKKVSNIRTYNARLAAIHKHIPFCDLSSVGTNYEQYGKLNLRFVGAKIWNTISGATKKNQC